MPVLKNPKHERFAQELAKGKTADEAYALAGYSANRGNAIRLKANERVMKRLQELQGRAASAVIVTVADIARQLDEDREFARAANAASAAVSATMGKAKVLGLIVDRAEMTGANGGPIETKDVSARDILADRISRVAARNRTGGDSSQPH